MDADHLINRLAGLAKREEEYDLVSHAPGERKAIELVRRDLLISPARECLSYDHFP